MEVTNPSKELIDLCSNLSGFTPQEKSKKGEELLAKKFGVNPWSADFYRILFIINDKIDEVIEIIGELELNKENRDLAINQILPIKNAFSPIGLQNPWSSSTANYLGPSQLLPLRLLEHEVGRIRSYPTPSSSEAAEIQASVHDLIGWLKSHQLAENDFIRQAIIDGLEEFDFRLMRLRWLGFGYALESLREVIGAYMALERGINPADNPDAEAILRKTGSLIMSVFEKVAIAKKFWDTGDFILKAYGAASLLMDGTQGISGLLPASGE